MPRLNLEKIKKILKRQKLLSQEILMHQRVMEGMRKGLPFDSLLKLIIDSVRKGMGFKRAGIFLVEPDGKHFQLALGTNSKGSFERKKDRFSLTARPGTVHISDVISGHKSYFLSNNVPGRIPQRYRYRVPVFNNAVVPIQVGKGMAIGALAVDNLHQNRPITKSDVSSLMNYATQVGLAIESFRTHERVVNLSQRDPMTGLYNRRFFDDALDQEINRCRRYSRAFSLLLIDIDRFKRVNDTYGHPAGDEVIRQVAALLGRSLRSLDTLARVGGEEFAVILPETPPQDISVVVKRLLREIRQAKPVVKAMAERKEKVTYSLGLATYKGGDATANLMMKLADRSLYQAKRTGRDRAGLLQVAKR